MRLPKLFVRRPLPQLNLCNDVYGILIKPEFNRRLQTEFYCIIVRLNTADYRKYSIHELYHFYTDPKEHKVQECLFA